MKEYNPNYLDFEQPLLAIESKIKQLKNLITNEKPDFLIVHLITIVPLFLFLFFNFKTKLVLRISGLPKLTMLRKIFWKGKFIFVKI